MRCLMKRLMLLCGILSLSSCSHKTVAVDSYCEEYVKIIRNKGDGNIKADPGVKKRILANELTFKRCPERGN
jgi:hypothetical protein